MEQLRCDLYVPVAFLASLQVFRCTPEDKATELIQLSTASKDLQCVNPGKKMC